MGKKSRRTSRRTRKERMPNFDIVNSSPGYSPERMAMNVFVMRQRSIATVSERARKLGGVVTDKRGPKGAGQFIRDAILAGTIPEGWHAPESPEQIAWLESVDWWEQILAAAERIGIVIPLCG